MAREQIYIDGVLMEQTGDKAAGLVFQSPFFTDIDSITGNRSNAIEFPVSDWNCKAVGLANLDRSGSRYPAHRHTAQYYLDGVQVFSGEAVLQGITPTALKFSFTWGNTTAFGRLLETKLRDLQGTGTEDDYVTFTEAGIKESGRYGRNIAYNYLPVPAMSAVDVLERLAQKAGVDIDTEPFARYRIPLLTRIADDRSKRVQALNISHGQIRHRQTTDAAGYITRLFAIAPTAEDSDIAGLTTDGGLLDVSGIDTLRLIADKNTRYDLHVNASDWDNSLIKEKQKVTVYACDDEGAGLTLLASLGERDVTQEQSNGAYYHRVEYRGQQKIDIDVSGYEYLLIGVGGHGATGWYDDNGGLDVGKISAIADPDKEVEVAVGGVLPLWANMPDWTGSQLLKNLMKIEGLFPQCPDDRTIRFVSVESLYARRAEAADWTERIDLEDAQPQERTTALSGYYQSNRFKWAEDEAVKGDYDGVLTIADDTLAKEGDLVKVDFAATDGGRTPVLEAWRYDTDAEAWEYEASGWKPRVLVADENENYSFDGMDWGRLLAAKYKAYARIVSNPRVVKCKVVIDAAELGTLDLTRPVYSYGAGCYWAVSKVTTAGDGTATAELLRMGEVGEDASSLRLPTYENPTDGLVVLREGDGWVTRVASHSEGQNAEMAGDGAYRIVMERWGYARRGKYSRYTNKYGKVQTTHTTREGATEVQVQKYSCYDDSGAYIGTDVLASVPVKGWAVSWYPSRKYVYLGGEWREQSEGHIFRDRESKGDSLPTGGHSLPRWRYGCYENVRDRGGYTKKWRAIGWDILLHGSEPEYSQTFTCGKYDGVSLVSAVGDALVLPPLGRYAKMGERVHNHARNGLTELAVSLWHHEPRNGGWVRVSNRVKVRSRSKDCTQLWEFDRMNVVEVE